MRLLLVVLLVFLALPAHARYVALSWDAVSNGASPTEITAIDTDTDILTSAGHGLGVGYPVVIASTGTMPGNIAASTVYYVKTVNGNDLTISTTAGGSTLNISTAGSGTITILHVVIYKPYWGTTSGSLDHSLNVDTATAYQLAIDQETVYVCVTATDGTGESACSDEITILAVGANTGSVLQTFSLTSTQTDTEPFTVGLVFAEGDTTGPTLGLADYQCVTKRTWNDGSVKHAICSGYYASTADTPATINVYSAGTQPGGTALTEADIVTAAPTASVQIGTLGTVALGDLLGSSVRTWISGPQMVEAHYQGTVGGEATVTAKFHVRLYASGEVWVRAIAENAGLTGATDRAYVPTVVIGGTTVYSNGGASYTHYANTRWTAEGWIGATDPELTIAQDTAYLQETKLVPNYWKTGPSEAALNGTWYPPYAPGGQEQSPLVTTYTPGSLASWWPWQGDSGFQNNIGLLPWWDALYVNSGADPRAYRGMIANALAAGSYPMHRPDTTTKRPIILSSYSTTTLAGGGGTDILSVTGGSIKWERNHHGSAGYLAYLVTGDYYHLETMQYQATTLYLCRAAAGGSGTSRIFSASMQDRGIAWSMRTIGQLAAIAPTGDSVNDDLRALFGSNVTYWYNQSQLAGQNQLGFLYTRTFYPTPTYPDNSLPPWQHMFWIQSMGMARDGEPLADATNLEGLTDHLYKIVVGMTGGNGTDSYCFTDCAAYTVSVSATTTYDTTQWFDSWGDAYEASIGSPNTSCGNTLNASETPAAYLANLLPALAYAVDHGAPGAAEGLARLEGATNWTTFETSGFESTPIWGIYPRSQAASGSGSTGFSAGAGTCGFGAGAGSVTFQ